MPKLTKSYVDGLKTQEKPYEVWDSELKGFGCRVTSRGQKTYYFLYRCKDHTKQRLKVGVHGSIACEIAREIVRGWAGDVARGINPKDHNKKQKTEEKQDIMIKTFLDIFVEKYKKVHNKPSTLQRDLNRIRSSIVPFLGEIKISEVTQEDILQFQEKLKNVPGQFNRCHSLLSKAFNLAELWGYRPKNSNPCRGIQKYAEKKKERFLTNAELEKLDEVLKREEVLGVSSPYSLAAIRLLMYTGCRLGEVLNLQWEEVFLKEGYLYLPDSKTGEKTIPLNKSAKAILTNLRYEKENPYVFVGEKPGSSLTTLNTAWYKIRSLANLNDVRIHDLRHTFASLAIKQGVDLYTVSKLLGHKNIATTTRYAHLEMKQLIEATNIVDQIWQGKSQEK
ncbi:MAG TPA: site-specific integrase [Alphaproteobacteria bacterium]|nr:site-specific integrase [Alphaproteobacteria bacterium]HQS93132.1 site-specific integrase [Alphaproteobacteria bacterium]